MSYLWIPIVGTIFPVILQLGFPTLTLPWFGYVVELLLLLEASKEMAQTDGQYAPWTVLLMYCGAMWQVIFVRGATISIGDPVPLRVMGFVFISIFPFAVDLCLGKFFSYLFRTYGGTK